MMSQPSKVSNSKKALREYVDWVSKIPYVEKVLLHGSRSPLSEKKHRRDSDWDLVLVVSKKFTIVHPRKAEQLHADVISVMKGKESSILNAVEIYPTDEHKIISK